MHEIMTMAPGGRLRWLFLRRQRLAVTLAVPGAAAAAQHARSGPHGDRLRVRLHQDGSVWCRPKRIGRTGPPYFRGELRETGAGGELTGTLHEPREQVFVAAMFGALAVFMAVVAVACAVNAVVPGLVVCGVAAVAFAGLSCALRALRPVVFRAGSLRLTQRLAERFGAALPPGW